MRAPGRLAVGAGAAVAGLSLAVVLGAAAVAGAPGALAGAGSGDAGAATADVPSSQAADASPAASGALRWALARVGTPCGRGGPGHGGFDCPALVEQAYAAAGVSLPRDVRSQYDVGPVLAAGAALRPGDLVFFGPSAGAVDRVGIALGDGTMVDAPCSGGAVRIDAIWATGYLGATRPAS